MFIRVVTVLGVLVILGEEGSWLAGWKRRKGVWWWGWDWDWGRKWSRPSADALVAVIICAYCSTCNIILYTSMFTRLVF